MSLEGENLDENDLDYAGGGQNPMAFEENMNKYMKDYNVKPNVGEKKVFTAEEVKETAKTAKKEKVSLITSIFNDISKSVKETMEKMQDNKDKKALKKAQEQALDEALKKARTKVNEKYEDVTAKDVENIVRNEKLAPDELTESDLSDVKSMSEYNPKLPKSLQKDDDDYTI